MSKARTQLLLRTGILVMVVVLAISGASFWVSGAGQGLDRWLLAQFFQLRGERSTLGPEVPVLMVTIDDESYAALNASPRWPFPVARVADGLERILAANPRGVMIELEAIESVNPSDGAAERERIDRVLKQQKVVTIDWNRELQRSENAGAGVTAVELSFPDRSNSPLLSPLKQLGLIPLDFMTGPGPLINYRGPKGSMPRLALHRVIASSAAELESSMRGRLVVFGFHGVVRQRGQIVRDELFVPWGSGESMFPVEISANVAENLLQQDWLTRASITTELYRVIVGCGVFALIGLMLRPTRAAPVLLLALGGLTVAAFEVFQSPTPRWLAGVPVCWLVGFIAFTLRAAYHSSSVRSASERLKRTYRVG